MDNLSVEHPVRYRICNQCWIYDGDLVLAMQEMTDASIEFILEKGNAILAERGQKCLQ